MRTLPMRLGHAITYILLASLAACNGAVEETGETGETGEVILPVDNPCDPPLALTPSSVGVPPFQLWTFTATGGTGDYRFALEEPALGEVHPTAGVYAAPGDVGTGDVVVVTDLGCEGEARAEVEVVPLVTMVPARAEVTPGTPITFEVQGAIDGFSCTMASQRSGGEVSADCQYVAGTVEGTDIVEVVDGSGFSAQATVVVTEDAVVLPDGYDTWILPLGTTYTPAAFGGSGVFDVQVLSGELGAADGSVEALVPGVSTVRVTDRFLDTSWEVTAHVVAPLVPGTPWIGGRSRDTRAMGPGDLNGDGYDDVVVAIGELNGDRWRAGGVFVYAGGSAGPAPAPAQTFLGQQPEQLYGSDIDVVDVDGDGSLDLLVGSKAEDFSARDMGAVYVYRGVAGGFFEGEPAWVLHGPNGFDRAGSAVGACDLNGDGFVDIVVGADGAEDRSEQDYPANLGGLLVFAGSEAGFVDAPVVARYGVRLDATGQAWEFSPNTDMAERDLAVGDVHGDGLCDVVVSVADQALDEASGGEGEGYALLWSGTDAGYLSAEPTRVYANSVDASADFSRRLAMADFDGDGRDDVVIASHAYSAASAGSGGVFAYLSGRDDGRPATSPYLSTEADWFVTAPRGVNLGRGMSVGDVDGDGVPDVLAGADVADVSFTDAGQVLVWSGSAIPDSDGTDRYEDAIGSWDGDVSGARLGESVAAAGDVDGDGVLDVVAHASEHPHYGTHVGRPFVRLASGPVALDLEGGPAGERSGQALARIDADGDGDLDVISGAPQASNISAGTLTGALQVHLRQGNTVETIGVEQPAPGIVTSFDRYAEIMTAASDFDGDGYDDLVVGSRALPTPNNWDSSWNNVDNCEAGRGGAGGFFVFRGGPTGVESEPAFVWTSPRPLSNVELLVGGFDHNGDGFDDLIVGDEDWSAGGGFAIVSGRPAAANTTILCADPIQLGSSNNARLGHAAAALGDLDGDGCDEIAVSADDDDAGFDDRGVVFVLWGHGGPGCPSEPQRTALVSTVDDTEVGTALAGGGDIDGDGVHDLVVSSVLLDVGATDTGGAWLVSGSRLGTLGRESYAPGAWGVPSYFELLVEFERTVLLPGRQAGVGFGRSLSLVPDPVDGQRMAVAVSSPLGAVGGTPLSGGVRLVRWDPATQTWEPNAYAVVAGESHLEPGALGNSLLGSGVGGDRTLLVGAPGSMQGGPDRGCVYVAPLP